MSLRLLWPAPLLAIFACLLPPQDWKLPLKPLKRWALRPVHRYLQRPADSFSTYLDETVKLSVAPARRLEKFRSAYQMIEVLSSPRVGNTLFIDGDLQLSAFDEFIYHEALAHIPLAYVAARPASVLVIGGGDGGVCARVLQHEWVASLTLVDIDEAPLTA